MPRKRNHDFIRLVGERLRSQRLSAGMTQEALAAAVGLQPAAISRMETGAIGTSLTTLGDLAEALGVPPGALVGPSTADAPSDEEARMLALWRSLDSEHRANLRAVLRWAAADQARAESTVPADDRRANDGAMPYAPDQLRVADVPPTPYRP